ncbi:MAG: ergothioneine biosynthesis protein EgtB [Gammaproteobacteria bacterium]|nr:ergothioneine biosynthesis protein EgtB [Gammaproteobacteria bacterium]
MGSAAIVACTQDNSWAARFAQVRAQTEQLSAGLSAEDCQLQAMPDASPTKWHLAHTTWFFETFVLLRHLDYRRFAAGFDYLFNSYYHGVGPMHIRAERGLISRPDLATVRRYRQHVDAAVQAALAQDALSAGALALLELGLHHEQQHQELILTDIKHALYANPLRPAYRATAAAATQPGTSPALRWRRFDEAIVAIGADEDGFAFDNERPRHRVLVPAFALAERPVTNAEYAEFVRAGGYAQPLLWLSDGWTAVQTEGWQRPLYWSKDLQSEFTLDGERELIAAAPVCHLSYYEADAFARWAGARLPTEFEWERAAANRLINGNFVDSGRLHPAPVAADGDCLFGDVWEWTASPYVAYPGFRPAVGAVGEYNGKFMCNQIVLRGGSCATPAAHIRASYRNFFPPPARWQFSGLRLARDA